MDPHKLAVALAIAAGWLSFNSLILSMYFILSKRGILEVDGWKMGEWLKLGRRLSPVAERGVLPSRSPVADIKVNTSSTLPSHEDSVEEVAPEKDKAGEYNAVHVLFVMYSQPNIAINKKLQLCLQNWEAHYDADLKVYIVPGVTPQNPLRIANAYPPGEMPSLEAFQQTENLISGVSVILEKPKRKRGFDKVQLEKLIIFTQQLAALGGEILDAQRQVATLKTFNAIRYK
ncbi:hypothetical protein SAMN04488142_3227 [Halomonas sp. hl-4]|nr:hypothetical protein SAMN04488142_3227 [Halomonas sp. hl-4]